MEVEECKCIYVLLVDVRVSIRPILSPNQQIARSVSNFEKSTQRGLPLLQQVLANVTLSQLASSYAERFVDYAFNALDIVDPHHGHYFIPYRDSHNLESQQTRRYQPSEAYREMNFGVEMDGCPMKYHHVVRRVIGRDGG